MEVQRSGFILYVHEYPACVQFYRDVMELPILFANESLTCFDLYGTYLMVEIEDRPENFDLDQKVRREFSCIRLNVANVKEAALELEAKGVEVDYQEHSWGTVAKFLDPSGNMLAFKDEPGFLSQLSGK